MHTGKLIYTVTETTGDRGYNSNRILKGGINGVRVCAYALHIFQKNSSKLFCDSDNALLSGMVVIRKCKVE